MKSVAASFTTMNLFAAMQLCPSDMFLPSTAAAHVNDMFVSSRRGARIETGGKRPRMKGYYYEPTVLTHDKMGSRILTEEVFGPVAPVIVVKDANDAIRVANSTEYGLGASIWTSDLEKAEKIARQIEAGNVFINSIVKSDPMLPFGGIKASGIGRELSRYGLLEFVNMKSIAIK